MHINVDESFMRFTEPSDTLSSLRQWVRLERQRAHMTQGELAVKSNVPATTISRLERTGLSSTDALVQVLFALNILEPLQDFLKERLRNCAFPLALSEEMPLKAVFRVRHSRKEKMA